MNYAGSRAIVTGGLGFIGSNLAVRLVELGAEVTIIDSAIAGCGANPRNLHPVRDAVRLIEADIGEPERFRGELRRADIIFNLAGEISHIHSMQFPERDLQVNTVAQLRFVLACSAEARRARVVYAGTRQVYGVPQYFPVDEAHPIRPVDFNGVHKFAAAAYHQMLTRSGALDAVVLRLTNVYGPRMALDAACQGVLSAFMRRAILGQQIEVFGDGEQFRDPVYVDDVVEAFLLAGSVERVPRRTFNVGGLEVVSLYDIARVASELGGCPEPLRRPFPPDRRSIDIGSYRSDYSRISRAMGWTPTVRFAEGMRRTIDYYRSRLDWYLDPANPAPACRMPEHTSAGWRLQYEQQHRSAIAQSAR